jgi:predicted MFS family arabinose efflux permease
MHEHRGKTQMLPDFYPTRKHHMSSSYKLLKKDFLALNALVFLGFCNIAIFFQFHRYLGTLRIDQESIGFLIGVFSLAVLALRPIISPLLHPGNAKKWIAVSTCMLVAALLLYHVARDLWSITVVRLLHGTGYVLFTTAVVSRLIPTIPHGRSGQAFGLFTVLTILPYAVIPPILEPLQRMVGGFDHVLDLTAAATVLVLPVLLLVKNDPRLQTVDSGAGLTLADVKENMKDYRIWILFVVSLLLWTSFTPVFYFLEPYGHNLGVTNAGWFFTVSTCTEIGVRLVGGGIFDRLDKPKLLASSFVLLLLAFLALIRASGPLSLYVLGVAFGLGWGVAMPVLNGLIFDVSQPRFRALNTNLSFEMFQGGFFVGPVAGGFVLHTWGYGALFMCCGLSGILASALLVPMFSKRTGQASAGVSVRGSG